MEKETGCQNASVSGGDRSSTNQQSPLPTNVTLPKGGGAIRGMSEKFETNPVTGTATMSVPIMTSPGRDGFSPSLAVSYDSAYGNGPFGFGWSLTLDSITRKTSRGLPRYADEDESDVFLVSGAEDLVPVLLQDGSRHENTTTVPGYAIHRYRPRIEGAFQKLERWTNLAMSGDVHWRLYSPDDELNIYGRSENSRIYNPDAPEQIYSWLLSDSRDWKGNSIVFHYKSEDGVGVDLTKGHQKNRGGIDDKRRTSNRYIKSIKYGNQVSFLDSVGQRVLFPSQSFLDDAGWLFEVVFDYGEHNESTPTPREQQAWSHRGDAFSNYRAGFEVRTSRLCKRVLMFHHFSDEQDVGLDCLVRSTAFLHRTPTPGTENRIYTYLDAIEQSGYRKDSREPTGYVRRSIPRLEFKYSEPALDDVPKLVDPEALENTPAGLASSKVRWIDLYGEGISGIFTQVDGAWYYKRNVTPMNEMVLSDGSKVTDPMFNTLETILTAPNLGPGQAGKFADLTGDGFLSVITEDGSMGFYQHDGTENWTSYQPFEQSLKASLEDPTLRLADLTGDGLTDALMTDESIWYPSLGGKGFGAPNGFIFSVSEDDSPIQIFKNDILGTAHFADFTGDGLVDIVRICNGEISVWPNLGYGKFGAKITMDNAPVFDDPHHFDPGRVLLADIDGSGTTDILYVHRDGARIYFNESGNSWSTETVISSTQNISGSLDLAMVDIHGNGTTCLVISSPLPADPSPMQYIDLMGSVKPHLLTQIDNNLGVSTRINYSTSTKLSRGSSRTAVHYSR